MKRFFLYSSITFICICCNSTNNSIDRSSTYSGKNVFVNLVALDNSIPNCIKQHLGLNYFSAEDPLKINVRLNDANKVFIADSLRMIFHRNNAYAKTICIKIKGQKSYDMQFTTNDNESIYQQFSIDVYLDTIFITKESFTSFNYRLFKKQNTMNHTKLIAIYNENQAKFDNAFLNQYFIIKGNVKEVVRKKNSYAIYLESNDPFTEFQYRMKDNKNLTNINVGQEIILFGKCCRPSNNTNEFISDDIVFYDCDIIN